MIAWRCCANRQKLQSQMVRATDRRAPERREHMALPLRRARKIGDGLDSRTQEAEGHASRDGGTHRTQESGQPEMQGRARTWARSLGLGTMHQLCRLAALRNLVRTVVAGTLSANAIEADRGRAQRYDVDEVQVAHKSRDQ